MNIKIIRPLFILLVIIMVLFQISCSNETQPKPNQEVEGNKEIEAEDWIWRNLGPDKAKIDQIQVASDGSVYLLTDSKLYLLQQNEFLNIGPQDEVAVFYVMEKGGENLIFAADNNGAIYLKRKEGLWKKTVSPVHAGYPVSAIAGDINRGIVYVGQSSKSGGGLWKSQDEGKSWEKLTDITVRSVVVHPQEKDMLYIIDKATFLSGDGGKHWEKIGTPANYGILIHPLDSQNIHIAYSKGVVTADSLGGVKEKNSFDLSGAMTCLEMNFCRLGEWAVSMWDYPSGSGGLYLSFDKGSTWTKADKALDKVRILDMRFDHKGDKLYLGTAGQGLWELNLQKIR